MFCDICHKNNATVHLTEVIKEKVVELHICQVCAKAKAQEIKDQAPMPASSEKSADSLARDMTKISAVKCRVCGLVYEDFKKKGRFGCGVCYETFKSKLIPLLRQIHGAVQHKGKFPFIKDCNLKKKIRVDELKNRLSRAIKLEEYEEAARLRDEIEKTEKC